MAGRAPAHMRNDSIGKIESEAAAVELANRGSQRIEPDRRRISRLARPKRVDDPVLELARNPELLR